MSLLACAGWEPRTWLLYLPACPFHAATGWPCPGCGMTRALLHLAGGQLREACLAHPLAPGLLAAMLWGLLGAPGRRRVSDRALAGLLAAVLGVWLLRLPGSG